MPIEMLKSGPLLHLLARDLRKNPDHYLRMEVEDPKLGELHLDIRVYLMDELVAMWSVRAGSP